MLKDKFITIDNTKENQRILQSVLHKILPFVFVLSFMWLDLFSQLLAFNATTIETDRVVTFITELFIFGALSAIVCAVIFWCYKLVLGFSLYTLLIPAYAIKDGLKWHFIIRNIIMGGLYMLCIYFPFIYIYLAAIDAIIIFVVFMLFARRCARLYSDRLVMPYVFRALMTPLIIYEFALLLINYVGWLI